MTDLLDNILSDAAVVAKLAALVFPGAALVATGLSVAAAVEPEVVDAATKIWGVISAHAETTGTVPPSVLKAASDLVTNSGDPAVVEASWRSVTGDVLPKAWD